MPFLKIFFIKVWKKEQDRFQTLGTFCSLSTPFSVQKPWPRCPGRTPAVRPATISPLSARAGSARGLTATEHQPASSLRLESLAGCESVAVVRRILLCLECLPGSDHVHWSHGYHSQLHCFVMREVWLSGFLDGHSIRRRVQTCSGVCPDTNPPEISSCRTALFPLCSAGRWWSSWMCPANISSRAEHD